jgi:hypothetical protein
MTKKRKNTSSMGPEPVTAAAWRLMEPKEKRAMATAILVAEGNTLLALAFHMASRAGNLALDDEDYVGTFQVVGEGLYPDDTRYFRAQNVIERLIDEGMDEPEAHKLVDSLLP